MTQLDVCCFDLACKYKSLNTARSKTIKKTNMTKYHTFIQKPKKRVLRTSIRTVTRECRKSPTTFKSVSNCDAPTNTTKYLIDSHYEDIDISLFDKVLTESDSETLMELQFHNMYSNIEV